jgi:dTMP kinase
LPDLTIYFKISGEEAARRLSDRSESKDRLEAETDEYRSLVEKGYQELISLHPNRFKVIDANGSLPEVVEEVKKVILESLNK